MPYTERQLAYLAKAKEAEDTAAKMKDEFMRISWLKNAAINRALAEYPSLN